MLRRGMRPIGETAAQEQDGAGVCRRGGEQDGCHKRQNFDGNFAHVFPLWLFLYFAGSLYIVDAPAKDALAASWASLCPQAIIED